jgi:O-antigen ligase
MSAQKNIKAFIYSENTFVFLISFVLITLPLKHIINSISLILFLIFALTYRLIFKNKITVNKVSIWFITIYVLVVLSLLWTIDFDETIKGLRKMLSFLIIPLGFISMPKLNYYQVFKILKNFSYSVVLYSLYCLTIGLSKYITTLDTSYLHYHSLSSPLDQISAIYLSVYVAFAIFFFIVNTKKLIHYFFIIILMVFLILLSSKIIVSITLLAIVVYLAKLKNKLLFISAFIIIITGTLIFISNAENSIKQRIENEVMNTKSLEVLTKEDFGENYYWTGIGLRLFQARSYFEMLNEDQIFLTGYGFKASQKKLIQKYKSYNLYPGFYNYNFHNQYIQILAELGIVGFLVLISIFFLGIKNSIKYKKQLFIAFNFLILFLCITETYLWRQRGMVFFITIFLLLYNYNSLTNFQDSKKIN